MARNHVPQILDIVAIIVNEHCNHTCFSLAYLFIYLFIIFIYVFDHHTTIVFPYITAVRKETILILTLTQILYMLCIKVLSKFSQRSMVQFYSFLPLSYFQLVDVIVDNHCPSDCDLLFDMLGTAVMRNHAIFHIFSFL